MRAYLRILMTFVILSGIFLVSECGTKKNRLGYYPDFITSNEDYYITWIGSVPEIDENSYMLTVKGLVKNPRTFTLEELRKLPLVGLPLTVECIGNRANGSLLSTAVWKGFRLYDLLDSLGLDDNATGVQYRAPDGYYASHTLEQIKTNGVIGALYMNGVVIPPK